MADQTVVTITGEQQKETETKVEEINTSMLLELEKTREATEELATSTTTSETEFYMNEFSSQKQAEESFSPTDDFLSFNQQARQIPTSDSVDLLSNDNPPLFSSEALHPEQVRDEKQVEIEKVVGEESLVEIPSSTDQEAPKSATDFLAKIAQAIESEPSANFAETKETTAAPSDFVPDDKEAKTDHEKQLENVLQESPAGKQADFGKVAGESDAIEVSSECKDLESASQAYDVPELYHEEQQPGVNDHPQIPLEQTGAISEKIQQEDDGLPEQLTSDKVTSLEMEVEIATVSREDEKLEEADRPTQMIREDLFKIDKEKEPEYSGPQVPGDFRMPIQWDKDVVSKAQEKSDECERPVQNTDEVSQNASFEQDKLPGLISVVQDEKTVQEDKQMARNVEIEDEKLEEADRPTQMICEDLFKIDKEKEPEYSGPQVPGEDVRMPIQWDKDVLSKAQEKSDECQRPIQITDEISQDASFDQDKLPGIIPVVQDEKTVQEDKQMARNVVIGEAALKGESLVSPAAETETIPLAEKPKAGQDRKDQKEANKILADTSSATMDHKKNTKKAPTTRKENVKAANSSISKNLTGRKKEDQKAERSKESTTKPPSTDKTAKPTSTTTALKTKTASAVTNARSTSATKRPVSAQTQKTGIGASKAGATKTIPKTTPRSSESRSPPGTTTGKLTTAKDKKPSASSRIQKSKAVESRPLSAVSTKSTDKKDRKVEATARPLSAKMKPASSGTTKTTAKKITTTTKTTSGPVSKFEVSKTTTIGSGITSKTKTTVKKSTESGGKTKASIDGMPQQKASARNNSSEMKRDIHGKPGSASLKSKPPSATTRGKPGNVMGKGKPTSERPKSPAKGTAKKSAPTKDETTASAPPAATESPAISSLQQEALDFMTTPDISAASKENVTTVMQCTEVIKDDGETKVLHTKEVTERVLENGEQQTITKETVVEESG